MKIKTFIDKIIVQPTGQCNLNCTYCYVPKRNIKSKISLSTINKIKILVNHISNSKPIEIIWHAGEPLIIGAQYFKEILNLFNDSNVIHKIQTNLTLLNNEWCELIKKNSIELTISLDGNENHNSSRVNWNNKESFNKVIEKISLLKRHNIEFNLICVVHEKNIYHPNDLFSFFKRINPKKIGFSIIEKENDNITDNNLSLQVIEHFWSQMFINWKEDDSLKIREFELLFSAFNGNKIFPIDNKFVDLNISIGHDGNIVILSPEFLDSKSEKFLDFIIGNINNETPENIIKNINNSEYLKKHIKGINNCYYSCDYFNYCEGGNASNKYFENDELDSTETIYCLQSKKYLVNSVLKNL